MGQMQRIALLSKGKDKMSEWSSKAALGQGMVQGGSKPLSSDVPAFSAWYKLWLVLAEAKH